MASTALLYSLSEPRVLAVSMYTSLNSWSPLILGATARNTDPFSVLEEIARAQIIDPTTLSGNTVKFGATVTVVDEDIVTALPEKNLINPVSPYTQ